jgi:hypothetical protein
MRVVLRPAHMEIPMREARIAAATKVATELFETENLIDHLFSSAARLSGSIPEARLSANLSGVMAQDVIESSAELLAAVATVRSIAIRMHGQLDELKTDIGLRTVGMGGGMYKGQLATGEANDANIVPIHHTRAA